MSITLHGRRVQRLYKTILRLHRGLPDQLGEFGTGYVKEEFRRHKKCSAVEASSFMKEWTEYTLVLAQQLGLRKLKTAKEFGVAMDEEKLNQMRDDQVQQLYELMKAATATSKKRPCKNV